ncbi:MAG TPA: TolC family protein [Polyangiaceae bacterium]
MTDSRWLGSLLVVALALSASGSAWAAGGGVLTLSRALDLGRRRAPEIHSARAIAASEQAQDDLARAAYYPSVTVSLTGQPQTQRLATPQVDPRNGQEFVPTIVTNSVGGGAGANAQWTLYDFGKTAGAVANADGQLAGADATLHATELAIVSNVANAYLNVVYGEKLRDVAQKTVDNREELVTIDKALIRAGLQPPVEQLRAEARAASARSSLAAAQGAAMDARAVLSALLQIDPASDFEVAPPRLHHPSIDVQQAMIAAQHLPSVMAALDTVAATRGVVDSAESLYLPTVGLQLNGSYQGVRLSTLQDWATTGSASAMLTVTETIFDPTISPKVRAARHNMESATALADQAKRDARQEAARAVLGMNAAVATLEASRKAAEGAASVLTVVQARYVQGLANPLELIDAESADADARTQVAQSELADALAVVRLYVAIGRSIREDS